MLADHLCEDKLLKLNPALYKRYCDSLFASVNTPAGCGAVFPDHTDRRYLHTINVLNYCDQLIGGNIDMLNCGEIYTLMMAVLLHDTGIGVSYEDYDEFLADERFSAYLSLNKDAPKQRVIGDLHHELSGCFIKKYRMLFNIPDEFVDPVVRTARGHRCTDLYSKAEYPDRCYAGKYHICLPYITAILRLADELDISAERNITLDSSAGGTNGSYSISVLKLNSAIKNILITEKKCIVFADKKRISETEAKELEKWLRKLRGVIKYTSEVVTGRTDYELRRRVVSLEYI